MVTPILFVSVQKTVRLLLHQSQVVESWTHGVGQCDDTEGELLLHVALTVEQEFVGNSIFNIEEALFVGTLHAWLDSDVAQFLVIDEDVSHTSTVRGDEAEHEGEVVLETLSVLHDILDELAVLGITVVFATIAAACGAC